jgi:hypothetical protein
MALVTGSSEVLEEGVNMPSKVRFVISFFLSGIEDGRLQAARFVSSNEAC